MTSAVDTVIEKSVAFPAAERRVRVELAAAHRIANNYGYNESIFNHFTVSVPGKPERFYVIPFGTHWSEARASDILEVDYDGRVIVGTGEVEKSAYCIHAPVHRLAPDAACVFHTHMPYASAFTRIENGRLEPTGQTEAGLSDLCAYDDAYSGLAFTVEEGERLAGVMGDKKILFMANHGVLVIGNSVSETFDRLYHLERACQVQMYAMWTGRPLKKLSAEVVAKTREGFKTAPHYGGKAPWELHFEALMRGLDRNQPDYKL